MPPIKGLKKGLKTIVRWEFTRAAMGGNPEKKGLQGLPQRKTLGGTFLSGLKRNDLTSAGRAQGSRRIAGPK